MAKWRWRTFATNLIFPAGMIATMDNPTIFGKIIRGEIPCDRVYEDDDFLAFRDIRPRAKVHVLVVPKQYVPMLSDYPDTPQGAAQMGALFATAARIAREMGLEGYKLQVHVGEKGGQEVFHVHVHLISDG